jgi:hypothetical protein
MAPARGTEKEEGRPPHVLRISNARTGRPASVGTAAAVLKAMGYEGPFEPEDPGANGPLYRVHLPHYGLPPQVVELDDGSRWAVREPPHGPH